MLYDEAIERLAEKVNDLEKTEHYNGFQRRNQVVDFYGYEFTRQGDANSPATIYVSISQDLIYYERFEFKLNIQPFKIPIASGGTNSVQLTAKTQSGTTGERTLNNQQVTATAGVAHSHSISPNPHNHGMPSQTVDISPNPHNHTVSSGITNISSASGGYRVLIEGVDMTPYFKAQYGGNWINGEGIYPSADLNNYDVLLAVGYMSESDRNKILKAGYKKIEIYANAPFNVTLINYLKYSHVNR